MAGKKCGKLSVVSLDHTDHYGTWWKCLCDCGNSAVIRGSYLRSGMTKSCGCYHKDVVLKHGRSRTPAYYAWLAAKSRCTNPKNPGFSRYGARGITICKRWLSFNSFLKDMGEKPAGLSLDRKNNYKGYSPSNCRWATKDQQMNNLRRTVYISAFGETKSVSQWARDERCLVKKQALQTRISKFGWTPETAMKTPLWKTKGVK